MLIFLFLLFTPLIMFLYLFCFYILCNILSFIDITSYVQITYAWLALFAYVFFSGDNLFRKGIILIVGSITLAYFMENLVTSGANSVFFAKTGSQIFSVIGGGVGGNLLSNYFLSKKQNIVKNKIPANKKFRFFSRNFAVGKMRHRKFRKVN